MGKIADIIRKYYGAILDTYYYTDDELEKTAYKIPEEEIIELLEKIVPNKKRELTFGNFNDGFNNAIEKMKKKIAKLKKEK